MLFDENRHDPDEPDADNADEGIKFTKSRFNDFVFMLHLRRNLAESESGEHEKTIII
jgi:hypothetical protein